jgi:hypothetical protein
MKVCIVSLNSKYIHAAPAPYSLGAGVLAFGREKQDVTVWEGVVGKSEEMLLSRLADTRPDAVAFSVYIWNVESMRMLLPRVRAILPDSKLILGGPEVSYAVEESFLKLPDTDYILSGEGEEPFARLLDALAGVGDVSSVPGCSYRTEMGVFVAAPFVGEGTPPSPLDFGYAEALDGRIAYIESSRGCPYHCAFCLSGRTGGVRYFDTERVKKDILRLANADTRTVKFVDRTFNADRKRAREIIDFILVERAAGRIPQGVCFHFEIAGELLDEDTLALLATAPRGLFQMEIGLQSFAEDTLRAIRRSPVSEGLCENIRRLVAMGNIHVHIDLIAGLPKEGLLSFRHGFDRAFALGAHMLQLGFLKLLHGAPMREEKEKFPCRYTEIAPYTVIETPMLCANDLADIALCEEGCERLYNSGKYRKTLDAVLAGGASPYAVLRDAGEALAALGGGYTLDGEVAVLAAFFEKHLPRERVRDLLLLDFLATNPSCYTPKALRREDGDLARLKRKMDEALPPRAGVRRAYAILYTEGCAAFADYDEKDPVTGRYEVKTLSL